MVSSRGRRQEYAAATKAAILAAARACFATDGYAGTSAERIAERARVAKGSVFHHFGDKQSLFEAVFIDVEEGLLAGLAQGLAGESDPREALRRGSELFLSACQNPEVREVLLVQAPEALGWKRWKALEERYFLDLVSSLIEQIGTANARLRARLVIAMLDEAGLAIDQTSDSRAAVDITIAAVLALGTD